jgi:hypothetical protein
VQPPIPAAQFGPLAPRPPPDPGPALDDRVASQHEPQLSVAAVARKLGIAPATLRTWDRRYGIGPADHTPGRYRRYSADDLARLELMRYALLHGASPASAANYALTTPTLWVPETLRTSRGLLLFTKVWGSRTRPRVLTSGFWLRPRTD